MFMLIDKNVVIGSGNSSKFAIQFANESTINEVKSWSNNNDKYDVEHPASVKQVMATSLSSRILNKVSKRIVLALSMSLVPASSMLLC